MELGDILAGKKPGRQHEREITLFKSVGMAVEDIATATYAYERALAEGLGTRIDFEDASVHSAPAALAELAAPSPSRAAAQS